MEGDGVLFRTPTTNEEEHNADFDEHSKKRNFGESFVCKPFAENHLLLEKIIKGKYKRDKVGNFIYKQQPSEELIPNLEYLFAKGIGFHSHPADWFNIFFPKEEDSEGTLNSFDN